MDRISGNRFRTGLFCIAIAAFTAVSASADPFAYMATGDGGFGTINLQTGDYTALGNSGQTLWGLGVANGQLFATDFEAQAGALYTVDPSNGHLALVGGSEGRHYWVFGSTSSGGLYGIDGNDFNLYSVNPLNGNATLVGNTGITQFGDWSNLSSGGNTLYLADSRTLYSLNTTTGAATAVGDSGGPHVGALAYVNGTLYGGENNFGEGCGDCQEPPCEGIGCDNPCGDCGPNNIPSAGGLLNIVTYNTTTGATTFQAAIVGINAPFFALAPTDLGATATPEPSTALLGGTLMALLFLVRRKVRA